MNHRKLSLYNKATDIYRVKLAQDSSSGFPPLPPIPPNVNGGTGTPSVSNMAGAASPWYKVNLWHSNGSPNLFAWTGAIGGAIPGAAVGYNLGHGLAKRWGLDENGLGSRLLRYGGAGLGGLAGWQIGKYSMLPFQAGNAAAKALGGGFLGGAANIGLMFGGTAAYSTAANSGTQYLGQKGTNWVNYNPLSHNDAVSVANKYRRNSVG